MTDAAVNKKPEVKTDRDKNDATIKVSNGMPEAGLDRTQMDSITLVIRRGKTGYGFSVTGSSPVTVKRVEEGSSAQQAGLQVGDAVIKINGQNVSRSIADSVAKIVRQSDRQVILDLWRETPNSHTDDRLPENTRIVCKADIEHLPSTSSDDSSMDLSHDSSRETSSQDSSRDQLIELGDWQSPKSSKVTAVSIPIRYHELPEHDQERQAAIRKLLGCEEEFVRSMQFGIQRYSNPLRHKFVSPAEHGTLFQNVETLVSISEYHVYKLREDSVGYNDVKDPQAMYVHTVGSIYLTKLLMMSEIFEQYCNGIKNAFRLLAELKTYEEFNEFLQDPPVDPGQLTISGFIQKPLEHIKNLVLSLQEVLSLTSLDHQDMDNLSQVIETLRNACNRINESNTRRSRSMTSLVSRSSRKSSPRSTSSRSSEQSGAYTIQSDWSGSSIESSVDSEVLDVQRRLVFCQHVQAFQLATATRHMIYSGHLMHVDGLLCTKLFVVLLSDLLLLTKEQPDNALLVVDYPILLHDIVEIEWNDNTTMDFTVGVEPLSNASWVEPRNITFRAPSGEYKCTWKNILTQRIESCKLRQEMITNMDNFV